MTDRIDASSRPSGVRLIHTTLEVTGSLVMAGGLLFGGMKILCYDNYSCDDFGGVAFLVVSLVITIFVWSGFMTLLARVRDRPKARRILDIAAGMLTVSAWLAYALL